MDMSKNRKTPRNAERRCAFEDCLNLFTPKRRHGRFCSAACRFDAWDRTHPRVRLVDSPAAGSSVHSAQSSPAFDTPATDPGPTPPRARGRGGKKPKSTPPTPTGGA